MNDRLHAYMTNHPHELLPSARKNYPSTPSSPVEEVPALDVVSIGSAGVGGGVGKGWKKSVRFSMAMFKD